MNLDELEEQTLKKPLSCFLKILTFFLIVGLLLLISMHAMGWFGEAASVTKEEFGPRGSLRKYEWFKDQAAAIDAKQADILIQEALVKEVCKSAHDRVEKTDCAMQRMLLADLKRDRNNAVKAYNAQSSKFNWEAYNKTDGDILPKTYTEN